MKRLAQLLTPWHLAVLASVSFVFVTATFVHAQTLTVLHTFRGGADGGDPTAGLTMDRAGNLYGTTSGNVLSYTSSAFQVKNVAGNWQFSPLYTFYPDQLAEGNGPQSKLVIGPDGALYGAAEYGGNAGCFDRGCGTVFKLQPRAHSCPTSACHWNITVLSYFSEDSGAFPDQIVFGPDGSIYGTTIIGGNVGDNCPTGCGTVFQLTNSGGTWSKKVLYEFNGSDGNDPKGGVILDSAGNLYGTTYSGGTNNKGVLYKLSPAAQGFWTQTILHVFDGSNGSNDPIGPLTMDASGNLYGACEGGSIGIGSVFELSSPGTWNYQTLYTFLGNKEPQGGLLLDSSGSIYGVLATAQDNGSLYKLSLTGGSWTYTDLHGFEPNECQGPNGGLVMDAQGNLFGTCFGGGAPSVVEGTVWEFTP